MLRWLLVLALALLPWHGWAGAGASPGLAPAAVLPAAGHHAEHHAPASADCAEHQDDRQHAAAAEDGCPGCSMCHSCSPSGLPALPGVATAPTATPQRPADAVSRFASADPVARLKPPIS